MSLVILLLSTTLWDVEGVSRGGGDGGGVVNPNVPKFPSVPTGTSARTSPRTGGGGVWELMLVSSSLANHNGTANETRLDTGQEFPLAREDGEDPGQRSFPPGGGGGGGGPISSNLNVAMRLRKLDYYFSTLGIWEEDCRHRALCEVARDPAKFSPLAIAFLDETRFIGDEKSLASRLLNSEPGTKLLSYIEATLRGNRRNGCEVYSYRCPQTTESMINYQTLLLWREISKWLTVKMVTRARG